MTPTQRNRFGAVRTTDKLPAETLLLRSLHGEDSISRPFQFVAEFSSTDTSIDFDKLVGHPIAIRLGSAEGQTRHIHGYVSRFMQLPGDTAGARYRAEIVPWLWLLSRTSDCRIHHRGSEGLTAIEIVESVFRSHGFTDYRLRLSRDYRKLEYCVQYRETALQFVSRLLEAEGVAYYFEHEADRHVLVLSDWPAGHSPAPGAQELRWHPQREPGAISERVWHWEIEKQLQPGAYVHTEYNFTRPRTDLRAAARFPEAVPGHNWEVFDYPGSYEQIGEGEVYARIRAEEYGSAQDTCVGESNALGLSAGHVFHLLDHPRPDQNRDHLLTHVAFDFDQSDYLSGSANAGPVFACRFRCVPAHRHFRPARITPRPVIHGEQTAVVVGPPGEEIHVDDHGRVKVHFHWDRHHPLDDSASCWLRVSQPWAGKGYGGMNIPRVGSEVIVGFLEGDPDRPIITGRVYNASTMPHPSNAGRDGKPGNSRPANLRDAARMTSFRSQSTPGGGGGNEITMNDTAGAEGLYFKAQRDEIREVGHDSETTVNNNLSLKVGNNVTVDVTCNSQETVGVAKVVQAGDTLVLRAGTSITLQCGASTLHMNQAGFITLSGTVLSIAGAINASVTAPLVTLTGAMALSVSGALVWSGSLLSRWDAAAGFTIKAGGDVAISGANIHLQA